MRLGDEDMEMEEGETPLSPDEEARRALAAKRTFFFSIGVIVIIIGLLVWEIVEHLVL